MKRSFQRLVFSNWLGHPTWQGVGVIITVIGLIISTYIAYDIYRRSIQFSAVTIEKRYNYNPIDFGKETKNRIAMLIDGNVTESVDVYLYSFANSGRSPILPTDYIEPIRVSVKEPWKLIAVDTDFSAPENIKLTWNKVTTNTFEMKPSLFNPGDNIGIIMFISNTEKSKSNDQDIPDIQWTGRIVNIPSIRATERKTLAESTGLGIFYTAIYHRGWNLYWLIFIAISLFLSGVFILRQSFIIEIKSPLGTVLLTLCFLLSFSSSDIIVDFWERSNAQWWGAIPLLIVHFLFISSLLWNLVRRQISADRKKKAPLQSSRNNEDLLNSLLEKDSAISSQKPHR